MTTTLPAPSDVATSLRTKLPSALHSPSIAIVCGSGLAGLSELLEERVDIPFSDIEGFQQSTVVGHQSKLSFGLLSGVPVVCQAGRFHYYEGKPLSQVVFPIRVFHALGCKAVIGAFIPAY
jgi:purine-nucleoside phosphorylase